MPDSPRSPAPHDGETDEASGPFTPDERSAGGSTPEVHDEMTPHDLPKDHPGRAAAVREAGEHGTLRGNT